MPVRLSTTVNKITSLPNSTNAALISEFYHYMKSIGTSENYQNQNLKAIIIYAKFLSPEITFYDIQKREQIVTFLDTKIKSNDLDPDKKWITTWNDYLWRIRDLWRIIKNLTGLSVEELDPPQLEAEGSNGTKGLVCPSCGRHISNESRICDNCGLILK